VVAGIAYTDTHCHLDFSHFDRDRKMVVEKARLAGLVRILNPSIDLETCHAVLGLADTYPDVYAAIGVHPNSALSWDQRTYRALKELASHPKVVAIGEIGLDYYRNGAPVEVQKRVFMEQLELAGELGLPVIIHNREASDDIRETLDAWVDTLATYPSRLITNPGALHSFSGDMAEAQWAVKRNFFIGITGPVTYKNATQRQQVAREIPLNNLLIETDAPYMPPHPYRGERNEPAHVAIIASKIAELRTINAIEVANASSDNAARLFGWRKTD
jgi:TatD DNase family protein